MLVSMWLLLAALAAAPQPPTWAVEKRPLTPAQLERKREGIYFTGVPLTAYDPDRGWGYGVRVYMYADGHKTDPLFTVSPYFHRLYVQLFQTTGGLMSHSVKWDAPYLFGTPYRMRSALAYERDRDAGYYGVGESALRTTISNLHSRFFRVDVTRPRWNANFERDLFGGRIRPLVGFETSYVSVRAKPSSKLQQDFQQGRIDGFHGGWDNYGKAGIAYDSRNYEPNPTLGTFGDVTAEGTPKWAKASVAVRGYVSPSTAFTTITLAARLVAQNQWGPVPFWELGSLTFTQGDDQGLGGLRTLRGYPESRFIGRMATLANAELRWTFAEWVTGRQRFGFMVSPFVDTGRIYDRAANLSFRDWHTGVGAGFRVIWNLATILTADYGYGDEGGAFYLNFGLTF